RDRAAIPTLGSLRNELTWMGAGPAWPGRRGDGPGTPGDCRREGHWGSGARPILVHRAGGRLWPSGPHGRRPPDAGRGPHPGGAAGGTLVGSRNLSPAGRLAPAAPGDAAAGGGNLVAAGPGCRPPPGGKIPGTAGRHEPEPPLAAPGQADRSL